MALSESDKKKLPFLVGAIILCGALMIYQFWYKQWNETKILTSIENRSAAINTNDQSVNRPIRPASLGDSSFGAKDEVQETIEYVDAKGVEVTAIVQPAPSAITSERSIKLTNEDKQIIGYLRANLLLKLQAENEALKIEKETVKTVVSIEQNGGYPPRITSPAHVNPQDLSGFTEVEMVKSTMLGRSMSNDEIDDVFDGIEVASISVGANDVADVDAYIRVGGKLLRAKIGRRIGDYEIKDIKPSHLSIRYIPGNVTQKIGHSGFTTN